MAVIECYNCGKPFESTRGGGISEWFFGHDCEAE